MYEVVTGVVWDLKNTGIHQTVCITIYVHTFNLINLLSLLLHNVMGYFCFLMVHFGRCRVGFYVMEYGLIESWLIALSTGCRC